MEPNRRVTHLSYFFIIPLIAVVAIVFYINFTSNSNKLYLLKLLKVDQNIETTTPISDSNYYSAALNNDSTMSIRYYPANVEKAEMKQFYFQKYLLLTLRTITGKGLSPNTFTIELPTNLNPDDKHSLSTSTIMESINQHVAINIVYDSQKSTYNFLNVKSWNALKLQ